MGEINQNIENTHGLGRKNESKFLNVDNLLKEIEDKLSNKDLSDLAREELEEFKTKLKETQEGYKKEKYLPGDRYLVTNVCTRYRSLIN